MARIKPQALLQQSKKKKGPTRISATTVVLYGLIVLVMVFFMFATYRHWTRRSRFQTEDGLPIHESEGAFDGSKKADVSRYASEGAFDGSKKADVSRYAIFKTSKGTITVELYKEGAPEVVAEFINSCQMGHFKGMQFNRVIKNFVIQGGDIERHGVTEDWTSRGKHYNQLDKSVKHEAFMIGTSKAKHDKEGFGLFITTAPIPDLNEKLNVFGHVIRGEDVVQEIEEVDTDDHYRPKSSIGIIDVTLKQRI